MLFRSNHRGEDDRFTGLVRPFGYQRDTGYSSFCLTESRPKANKSHGQAAGQVQKTLGKADIAGTAENTNLGQGDKRDQQAINTLGTRQTPAAALPPIPTPIAEPIPAIKAAKTAPSKANTIPRLSIISFLLDVVIFCMNGKRLELPSAALIKLTKKLNEL